MSSIEQYRTNHFKCFKCWNLNIEKLNFKVFFSNFFMKFLGRFEKNELEIYRPQIFSRKNIKNFKMDHPSLKIY